MRYQAALRPDRARGFLWVSGTHPASRKFASRSLYGGDIAIASAASRPLNIAHRFAA